MRRRVVRIHFKGFLAMCNGLRDVPAPQRFHGSAIFPRGARRDSMDQLLHWNGLPRRPRTHTQKGCQYRFHLSSCARKFRVNQLVGG